MTKRWKDMTDEEKQKLREAQGAAYSGANAIIAAYNAQGIEAIRDAINAMAEALPEDVMGGYAD